MDKFSKMLVGLTLATVLLMVVGDIAYAKYRASGHRYPSVITARAPSNPAEI